MVKCAIEWEGISHCTTHIIQARTGETAVITNIVRKRRKVEDNRQTANKKRFTVGGEVPRSGSALILYRRKLYWQKGNVANAPKQSKRFDSAQEGRNGVNCKIGRNHQPSWFLLFFFIKTKKCPRSPLPRDRCPWPESPFRADGPSHVPPLAPAVLGRTLLRRSSSSCFSTPIAA